MRDIDHYNFYESVNEIKQLDRVKSVAWHIVEEDPADRERDLVSIRVEDMNGTVVEIPFLNPYGNYSIGNDRSIEHERCVIVFMLLKKLHDDVHDQDADYDILEKEPWLIDIFSNYMHIINVLREILPYEGDGSGLVPWEQIL